MPIEHHHESILTLEQERAMLVDMRNHYHQDNPKISKLRADIEIEEIDKSIRSIDEAIEANKQAIEKILHLQ